MGTRFLLTQDSDGAATQVKALYLRADLNGTVVTTARRRDAAPGAAHRTRRQAGVKAGPIGRLPRAVRNAVAFQKESGTPWTSMLREGMAMKHGHELAWSQVIMAANTPMLLKASMVDGRADLGLMTSGQVVGLIEDLPSVEELISRIIREAGGVLDRLTPQVPASQL